MIWLIAPGAALLVSVLMLRRGWVQAALAARLAFYLTLAVWIWTEAGEKAFRGSETGLMGWFIIGLAFFAVGDVLAIMVEQTSIWALLATGLAALAFALGFDILRPDDYAVVPGVVLLVLVASVGIRATVQMTAGLGKPGRGARLWLGLYVAAIAVMVFAGVFKMIDRGWALPWAYLASGGALVFAAGQLWLGWERMLAKQSVPVWVRVGALNLGQLMMVMAAVFVYREFL